MQDVQAKKSLGQHWLNNSLILDSICDEAKISSTDHILEIGPGKGSLTRKLLTRGAKVFAVEFDGQAMEYLNKHFEQEINNQKLELKQADIRKLDLRTFDSDYKIVANIPYYLTSHLIYLISESANPPQMAVLLVQKEVAERICSKPGGMSLLSVTAQFFWEASLGIIVPPQAFTPPPKVNSQVIILQRRQSPLFDVDTKTFFRLVKSGFSARRKTLLNSLSGGLRLEKKPVLELLESAKIDPKMRPQELSMNDWHELYKKCIKYL